MIDQRTYERALVDLEHNEQQYSAVLEKGNCVVLAGPGSGKTKTLTLAMARALLQDVQEPRGIACITYNNESAYELQDRLLGLGIQPSRRIFVGTVHGFALSQIIMPYARCLFPEFSKSISVATSEQISSAFRVAMGAVGDMGDPKERKEAAATKRRRDVDRSSAEWLGRNPETSALIEAYEAVLRRQSLIDFDDMPLLAYRMVKSNPWIGKAVTAKFPQLFVDEYQDLGVALHELVLEMCFKAGARLFAVGDPDQSIYAFTGAHPELLMNLSQDPRVRSITLRVNYRCARNIVAASVGVLQEARDYTVPDDTTDGIVIFLEDDGSLESQAKLVFDRAIPQLRDSGRLFSEIAVLYRNAKHGDYVAYQAAIRSVSVLRADNNALVKRSNPVARFIDASAAWTCGGWRDADPPFSRLSNDAANLALPIGSSGESRLQFGGDLMTFLEHWRGKQVSFHDWLTAFYDAVLHRWQNTSTINPDDWQSLQEMLRRTAPGTEHSGLSLSEFSGRADGDGRLTLSTLHSSKGREFKSVIMFAMNSDIIPNWADRKSARQLREARRLFYVGVTRAKRELYFVNSSDLVSPFVEEFRSRLEAQ